MPARGGAVSLRQLNHIQHQWANGEYVLHDRGVRDPCLVGGGGSPDSHASSDHEEHHRSHRPSNKGREPKNGGQPLPCWLHVARPGHMQPTCEGLAGSSIHSINPLASTTSTLLQPTFDLGLPLPQQPPPPNITLIAVWDGIPFFLSPSFPTLRSQIDTTGDNGSGFAPGPVQDLFPGPLSPSAQTGQYLGFHDFGQSGVIDFDQLVSTGDYTTAFDSWPGSPPPTQPTPSPFLQTTPQLSPANHSFLSAPSSGTSPTSHSLHFAPSLDTSPIAAQTSNTPRNGQFPCPTCGKVFPTKIQVS